MIRRTLSALVALLLLASSSPVAALELVRQKNVETRITFPLISATDDVTPLTGCSASGDTEIDAWSDAADPDGFADITDEIAEIGTTGIYFVTLTNTELNVDYAIVKSTCTGANVQTILIRTTVGDPLLAATTDDGGTINVTTGAVDSVTTTTTATTATNLTNLPSIPANWLTAAGMDATAGAEIAGAVYDEPYAGHTTADTYGQLSHPLAHGTVAAAAANSVTLDADASSVNNYYNGALVRIVAGTGAGQTKAINAYTGATKVGTLTEGWGTTPDAASKYVILPASAVRLGVAASSSISATAFTTGAITASVIADGAIDNATLAADIGSTAYATNVMALAGRKLMDELNLDHLMKTPTAANDMTTEIANGSALGRIIAGTDTVNFVPSVDSLASIRADVVVVQADLGDAGVGNSVVAKLDDIAGAGFVTGTDSLLAVRTLLDTAMSDGTAVYDRTTDSLQAQRDSTVTTSEMVTAIEASTVLAKEATVGAIKATTDKLDTTVVLDGAVYDFTAAALAAAPSGSGLDAAGVRAAIGMAAADLDTQLGALPTAAENAIAGWSTLLPGSYGAGTGGYVVGSLLARESSVLGQFSVTTGIIQAPALSSQGKITVTRGDTRTLTFTLGTGWPLTGKRVYFTAKSRPTDTNASALVAGTCTVTDAVNGVATYTPAATDFATAGTYYYDVEVRNTDETSPQTAWVGTLVVTQDVRQ